MKLYKGDIFNGKIEIKEIEFTRETEKRYYIDNNKNSFYIDKDIINKYRDSSWVYGIYATDKQTLLSIIKNHYIEENEKLKEDIERNNDIIKNAEKLQKEIKK